MGMIDRAVSALLAFMGILFTGIVAWALTETFAHARLGILGSRMAVFWAMVAVAAMGAALRWRRLARRARPARTARLGPQAPAPTSATGVAPSQSTPTPSTPAPREIDMADAADVAWVQAQRDPALWHLATMAALAYRGNRHGFVHWVLRQPELDRATAGWIFLWAEGSRYLRGKTDFYPSHVSGDEMLDLLRAVCERSEGAGFSNDALGLDGDFEAERTVCLAAIHNGQVAAGIVAPTALLARAFSPPRDDGRFTLDDGIILV
ncbi:MAG TPA: hypothetical protein VK196_06160 [Magnetospirillum sp.]|nr:hypothetical protein [Magnetospirillum sp.]